MKTKLLFLALVLLSITIQAQMVSVALHKALGGTAFFTGVDPFKDAYAASAIGDTIYLSGGSFAAPTNFDKRLVIYGVGHYPDSTAATGPTSITGTFNLTGNADNFHLEGVHLTGSFTTDINASVNAFTVKRVKIDGSTSINGSTGTPQNSTNIIFSECIFVGTFTARNLTNSGIFNSIFNSSVYYSDANVFRNNIFLSSFYAFNSSNNNEISNNIFSNSSYTYFMSNSSGNTIKNNVFVISAPDYGTLPTLVNNYTGRALANIYVSSPGTTFSYTQDYHLKTLYTSTDLGADATQVGIYGGTYPFKTANVPMPPHISTQSIGASTDISGNLNINITVNAQNN